MDRKTLPCLQKASQHVPIYLQQFPSYSNCKKNRHFYVPQPSFFVCPGDAPVAITQNVAWMKTKFSGCQTSRSMYLCICNSFRVIRSMLKSMRKSKKSLFCHIFVSPGDTPGAITLNVVWMEREFDAYKLSRCMCPSNYYRFWDTARYLWKSRHFIIPLAFDAPVRGVPVGISAPPLEW